MNPNWNQYSDIQLLIACLFGEAEGEGIIGQLAVGCVIRNRVEEDGWYGQGYKGVILKPWQFSSFNEGSPRIPKMIEFMSGHSPLRQQLFWIGHGLIYKHIVDDITHRANHFLTKQLVQSGNAPSWYDEDKVTFRWKDHVYLRL